MINKFHIVIIYKTKSQNKAITLTHFTSSKVTRSKITNYTYSIQVNNRSTNNIQQTKLTIHPGQRKRLINMCTKRSSMKPAKTTTSNKKLIQPIT
eukprot:gene3288-2270_t